MGKMGKIGIFKEKPLLEKGGGGKVGNPFFIKRGRDKEPTKNETP